MPIGGLLRDRDSQYVAHRDQSGTWRILDAWDDELGEFEPDADIPDGHEAVTILSEGAYHAVLKEAARLGILAGAANAENFSLREYCEELESKIGQLEKENKEPSVVAAPSRQPDDVSESYLLKESALKAILKLTALEDVSGLTKYEFTKKSEG
tara:strand:+ start:443 stop:904 length:462 start_codon:yes stop_codon:yes gene_type:complete